MLNARQALTDFLTLYASNVSQHAFVTEVAFGQVVGRQSRSVVRRQSDQVVEYTGFTGRITLEDTEEETRIRLTLRFDRAWASVVKGTEDADFVIDDRDRSEGLLYVTFVGPQDEEDSGWFDWLWGGEDEHPLA